MSQVRLQTPEGISFSFILAGPVSRMLAWFVDIAVIMILAQTIAMAAGMLHLISIDFARAFVILSYFVISILYGIILEYSWHGQTIGKRLLRLRVIDRQGLRLTPWQVALRNLLRFVDALPFFYLVGGSVMLLSKHHQRLGDFAANTLVIRQPRLREPDLNAIDLPKFNSLRNYPHLVARLRNRISPQEASVLLEAVLRREEFTPEARLELFKELGSHCRALVEFPDEVVDSITDEQMIRNILDVIYEKAR